MQNISTLEQVNPRTVAPGALCFRSAAIAFTPGSEWSRCESHCTSARLATFSSAGLDDRRCPAVAWNFTVTSLPLPAFPVLFRRSAPVPGRSRQDHSVAKARQKPRGSANHQRAYAA
jgi:hypothetical protein